LLLKMFCPPTPGAIVIKVNFGMGNIGVGGAQPFEVK